MIRHTELKSTNRQNLMEVLPLQKPFTVLVEPSKCFQGIKGDNYFTRNQMNMPLARFRKIIEQLQAWEGPKLKVLKLSLYGEPLINSDFCEMLRIASEVDITERIETTTNASLLTRANLGTVDERSLQEIWNSEPWHEFQRMQLEKRKHENYSCARCDIYLSDHYTRDNIDGFDARKLQGACNNKSGKNM